jgi:hypothetical protein
MIAAHRLKVAGAMLCLALLLAACIGQPSGTSDLAGGLCAPPTPVQEPPSTDRRRARLTPVGETLPARVTTPAGEAVTGEAPQNLLEAIFADAAARSGTPPEAFVLLRAEAVVWNGGSLGCPQPGVMHTQVLVDGYWVVLENGDEAFDYRAIQKGGFILCEQSLPLLPLAPGPGDQPPLDR